MMSENDMEVTEQEEWTDPVTNPGHFVALIDQMESRRLSCCVPSVIDPTLSVRPIEKSSR